MKKATSRIVLAVVLSTLVTTSVDAGVFTWVGSTQNIDGTEYVVNTLTGVLDDVRPSFQMNYTGDIYNNSFGSIPPGPPNQALVPTFPDLAFDSYVTMDSNDSNNLPFGLLFSPNQTLDDNVINVGWAAGGGIDVVPPGVDRFLAQITLLAGPGGAGEGGDLVLLNYQDLGGISQDSEWMVADGFIVPVPEPTTLATVMMCLALLPLCRRR